MMWVSLSLISRPATLSHSFFLGRLKSSSSLPPSLPSLPHDLPHTHSQHQPSSTPLQSCSHCYGQDGHTACTSASTPSWFQPDKGDAHGQMTCTADVYSQVVLDVSRPFHEQHDAYLIGDPVHIGTCRWHYEDKLKKRLPNQQGLSQHVCPTNSLPRMLSGCIHMEAPFLHRCGNGTLSCSLQLDCHSIAVHINSTMTVDV
jgi:hypothetical protein